MSALADPLQESDGRGAAPSDAEVLASGADAVWRDLDLTTVKRWKGEAPGRRAVGYMPVFAPREVAHAAGMLPVGIFGGGDQVEIIRGDACFQSYICHIPRSTLELALAGRLDALDAMIFPSTCDVIRNLSGIWKLLRPAVPAHYVDVPQNFDPVVGGRFFEHDLRDLALALSAQTGRPATDESLRASIAAYNENRRLTRELDDLRRRAPHLAPASECYALVRAGYVMPVEEHTPMLRAYLEAAGRRRRSPLDNCRVVLRGAFCEQPPPALLVTLERAGCDIVDDDLLPLSRWHRRDVDERGDPFEALARAFLSDTPASASVYTGEREKGEDLVRAVRESRAEGVLFAAASFCDPALLDQPMLAEALDRAGIPYTVFKFAEDTGQFQTIREQAGTFADSIKLWSEP